MDFTELYKHSSGLVSVSPGAHFILNAIQDRLIVRRVDSFQITRTWLIGASSPTATMLSKQAKASPSQLLEAPISHVGWSCDSEYLLAASSKRGTVDVFKLRDEDWNARIETGAEGLVKAEWAPDGRNILCFSEWGLRVTIWSLVSGSSTHIQFPLHPDRGYTFRSDGRYFVLAERHKSKDTLGIYDVQDSYRLARHFPLPTSNLSSLALSPTGNHVAVWEHALNYKVHVVSLTGDVQGSFAPEPDPGFGVRHVAWHPSGMFLAVSGWDNKIYILDSISWSPTSILELSSRISANATLWREPANWLESTHGRGFLSYERLIGPQTITVTRADSSKAYPKSGTIQLEWNKNGSILLARFENVNSAVYLYDFPSASEPFVPKLRCVLANSRPIVQCRWNPIRKGSLALCCGEGSVYTWSNEWVSEGGVEEDIAECIGVPAKQFETQDLQWAPDGKGLVLLDKETFCCAFEVEDENIDV
ncbi:WD repeat-containing protein 8 [Coniophora puteana RWD-64-598 SS2]|uniref:WD repeat-containing protein 8 n=1 Tax=Coniophora puteana (strain RWD-64-598) TaxID=741705 RepID=A0A5M3N609_CONPW|nr:WD repeat-containing protein 8 [Coniophora puteana RWD-64-598 SS2]EIW86833.1 WD repeat-containing protein 8 [Coniophora puteana RWD-64-598 SS2]